MRGFRISAGIVVLVLTAASVDFWLQGRSAREIAIEQQARIVDLERDSAAVSTAETSSASARSRDVLRTPADSIPSPGPASGEVKTRVMDPAQRAAYLAQRKLSVRAELADLRQWMEISDEKFEQLIELHANQGAEAREGAHLPQEQRTLMQQRHEGEIKEFLGADGYKKRQEWAAASWPRMWVDSLNAQLPEGSRVDANGKYRVAQAMAKAQARLHAEHMASEAVLPTANDIASRMAKNDRSLDLNRRVREAVRSAAIPHLSGQQMTALDSVLETHYRVAEEMYERKRAQLRASGN